MAPLKNFYLDAVKGRPSAEVFNGILCLYALLQRGSDEYFRPYELTPVKFNTLILIRHMGGVDGLSQNDICHHLIVSPSNITRLIDRLVVDGYVERTIAKEDRRVRKVKITSKGKAILDEVTKGYGEMIQQSIYKLERSEVEQLSALILKLFSRLNTE